MSQPDAHNTEYVCPDFNPVCTENYERLLAEIRSWDEACRACSCGERLTMGTVHRLDRPCWVPERFDGTEMTVTTDEAVEAIRVASFEAPRAGSHAEWKRRIEEILAAHIDGTVAGGDDAAS